jgi:hypothetical protein
MREILLTIGALAALVAASLVHGAWTNRWRKSAALEEAVAGLERMPSRLGGWRGEDLEMDPRQFARGGVDGWKAMRYTDSFDASSITTLLLVGRPGPVSVHTPDVCYGGAGYEMIGEPVRIEVAQPEGPPAEFWTVIFRKQGVDGREHLRIFWSWQPWGGNWQAPDSPRAEFGNATALHKLYVVHPLASADEPLEDDPSLGLIRDFLKEFGKPGT